MVKKILGAVVVLTFLVGLPVFVYLFSHNKLHIGYNINYEPTQPIPFSHAKHAGELKVDCKYCHTNVAVSRHSSIPSVGICINCHLGVPGKTKDAQAKIKMVTDAYKNKKSIPWVKVHMLPDHVKFNHSKHIAAGKDCQTCHGPVEKMERVYQYSDLSMGWCVNCHRGYTDPQITKKEIAEINKKNSKDGHHQAPINCSTCHY